MTRQLKPMFGRILRLLRFLRSRHVRRILYGRAQFDLLSGCVARVLLLLRLLRLEVLLTQQDVARWRRQF